MKKVFVSGCFDMMHSGHVRFLEEACAYGDVYVGIGSDRTIKELKGRYPVTTQDERKYVLESLRYVKQCLINSGTGMLDFLNEIKAVKPDYLIVNEEGNNPSKADLCRELEIEYVVLKRKPQVGLPARSTTSLRNECTIPYRIDLAGGWLDQPFVSKLNHGCVLGISIEPTLEFNDRSGMATSTRYKAIDLWHSQIPEGDSERLAKILFAYENPPGTTEVAGSQDSINLVMPALKRLNYTGAYWPSSIEVIDDEATLSWLESCLYLIPLEPRNDGYDVLNNQNVTQENVARLASAADSCWNAIRNHDASSLGKHMRESFEAQVHMFPNMINSHIQKFINQYQSQALGWKISGAGGGGYLIFVSDRPIINSIQIKIRR